MFFRSSEKHSLVRRNVVFSLLTLLIALLFIAASLLAPLQVHATKNTTDVADNGGVFLPTLSLSGISAQSAILIDADSGIVLYAKDESHRLPMASTTKIMTALCAVELADT